MGGVFTVGKNGGNVVGTTGVGGSLGGSG